MALTFGVAYLATAQNYTYDPADPLADPTEPALNDNRPDAPWITLWWALDGQVTDNGGFAASAPIDWLSEGTGGAVTQESVSTLNGLLASQGETISLPGNGGDLGWGVFTIDPLDGNNMSTMYGLPAQDNFDTYAIIVIESPNDRDAVFAVAHDDHVQLWVNGDKVYNNSKWTGAATEVDYEVPVSLSAGANVLLYRCGESGGSDYFNGYFSGGDDGLTIHPETDSADDFWVAVRAGATAVEPGGKLPTIWGDIKRQNR